MRIKFEGEYKSLKSFESDELNEFTVITGKNGSGKTQLVKLFENKSQNNLQDGNKLQVGSNISSIQIEGISSSYTPRVGADRWSQQMKPFSDKFSELGDNAKELISLVIKEGVSFDDIQEAESLIELFSECDEKFSKSYLIQVIKESNHARLRNNQTDDRITQEIKKLFSRYRDLIIVLKKICQIRDCKLSEVKPTYFTNTPLPERFFDINDLFNSRLQDIFYAYAKRRYLNEIEYLRGKKYGWDKTAVSDSEFVKQNNPPWEIINQILEEHEINYYFEGISLEDFSPDSTVEFTFRKKSSDTSIRFSDLSSGEEVIIGLIIKLFTSEFYEEKLEYPDLIVLDEPDAHLHPEMSKLLIDVLNETFVRDYGIKIIMTTHSPSTIALTPEESVYQLSNEPETELKKNTKG
ncbi:ATP-binding protein [Fodinibius sp.]|uniref:ATP-binding protein n=1 Tax=Fodinibius sp. TaxID=1872440 RepID=UPI002ACE23B3|nr:ATP-binding protein [Fodinibius sp.]MDZ7659499.1 ATP-binding protein [Fodinibius sp.]